jgi:hypothetical protein
VREEEEAILLSAISTMSFYASFFLCVAPAETSLPYSNSLNDLRFIFPAVDWCLPVKNDLHNSTAIFNPSGNHFGLQQLAANFRRTQAVKTQVTGYLK